MYCINFSWLNNCSQHYSIDYQLHINSKFQWPVFLLAFIIFVSTYISSHVGVVCLLDSNILHEIRVCLFLVILRTIWLIGLDSIYNS
jgi:hypothetical protein